MTKNLNISQIQILTIFLSGPWFDEKRLGEKSKKRAGFQHLFKTIWTK